MLYKGNLEEASRREEQTRKSHCVSHKHNVYRNTRCTSMWQEEQSALAGGVINTYLDSDDEDAYTGEQKEIQREAQELRAVQSWINQEGWDAAAEGRAVSQKNKTRDRLAPCLGRGQEEVVPRSRGAESRTTTRR